MDTKDDSFSIGKPVSLESAAKAFVSAVPAVGSVVSSVVGDYQNHRKLLRIVDFINGLKED